MDKKAVTPKTWDEFRKTGLFMFVNTLLHAFGWALVVEVENYKELGDNAPVTKCYPARVTYRGFDNSDVTEMHQKMSTYVADNAQEVFRLYVLHPEGQRCDNLRF